MRIIKKGEIPANRIWRGECHNCQTEVEAIQSELKNISSDFRDGGMFSWETCPVCGAGGGDGGCGYGGVLFYPVKKD